VGEGVLAVAVAVACRVLVAGAVEVGVGVLLGAEVEVGVEGPGVGVTNCVPSQRNPFMAPIMPLGR
jgi:hypothetical protein